MVLIVVGLVMWLLDFLPIQEPYKQIVKGITLVCAVLYTIVWLLQFAGFSLGAAF